MAQYRRLQIAQGHVVTVRLARTQTDADGLVTVTKSHRPPFNVPRAKWDQGEIVRV
jgi:hypothetical protein